jgi:hypothetical protein
MDRKKALATAGALVLTASGAVSALFLTVGADNTPTPGPPATTEIVEFVDAAGNPRPAATTGVTDPQPAATPAASSTGSYTDEEEEEEHDEDHEEEHEEEEEGEHDD